MFIDEGVVRVRAGHGGKGCVSFLREKYMPHGGPDGGDGGRGGSIFIEGDRHMTSLIDITSHPTYTAKDGQNGGSNRKNGRAAGDLYIRVPVGTVVSEIAGNGSKTLLADILSDKERFPLARGGRGGGGNARFASAKYRLPRFALLGAPGVSRKIHLSLKLLSDIAIVGLPNCGKSTLLAAVTRARPKIADYPFTTLSPNLGVLQGMDTSIVLADIPGLVEGAHAGKGLGNRFLKHIERSRALLILLDASAPVVENYSLLRSEILEFNPLIWERPRVVAVNKLDLVKRAPLKTWAKRLSEDLTGISAKTGRGIEKLLKRIETLKTRLAGPEPILPDVLNLDKGEPELVREEGGYRLLSKSLEELAFMLPKNHTEARQWFVSKLETDGIFRMMNLSGAQNGDVLRVGPQEFMYEK